MELQDNKTLMNVKVKGYTLTNKISSRRKVEDKICSEKLQVAIYARKTLCSGFKSKAGTAGERLPKGGRCKHSKIEIVPDSNNRTPVSQTPSPGILGL